MRALMRTVALLVVALAIGAPAHAYRQRKVSTTSYPNCFKLVDSSDHVTPKTSATVTCTRSKNGGSFASCSGSVSEVANGVYCLAGHATDRDTVGTLVLHMTASGADPNDFEIEITTNDPFANLDTATAVASVTGAVGSVTGSVGGNVVGSVGSVTGNVGGNVTGSVGSVATGGITAASIAADAIGASELASDAVSEIQDGLATTAKVDEAISAIDNMNTNVNGLPEVIFRADVEGYVDPEDPGSFASIILDVDSDADAIRAKTDQLAFTVANQVDANALTGGGGGEAPTVEEIVAGVWQAAVRTLTTISGTTNILSPTGTVGTLRLTRNDSYYIADGPIPTFTRTGWPDLAEAAEIRLTVRRRPPIAANADPVLLSVTDRSASRVVGSGEQTVAFELSALDTASLVPGVSTGKYDIQATFPGGHVRTLETGTVTVIEDQTRPE